MLAIRIRNELTRPCGEICGQTYRLQERLNAGAQAVFPAELSEDNRRVQGTQKETGCMRYRNPLGGRLD